jgi:hypothetical protein
VSRLLTLSAAGCLALFGCADVQHRQAAAPRQSNVTVRASLERTAVWVGDPVAYTIEVLCSPGYDIVEDDLGRDHLQLTGLEVRAASVARAPREDGAVAYRASFQLVSYASEDESLRIGARSLRYYQRRDDGAIADERPAGTVEVPREDLVLRSALPDSTGAAIRTVKPPAFLPRFARMLQPLGLALVVLSLSIVATALAAPIARRFRRVRKAGPARLRPPTNYRIALDDIRRMDGAGDPSALRQAFERLDRLLRERLAEAGIDARSLTPDEIDRGVGSTGDTATPGAIARVLRECERVRYGGVRHPPSHDLLAQTLVQAEAALAPADGLDR